MPDSAPSTPLVAIADGVATVTLNRPAHRNRLEDADLHALLDTLARIDADPAVRVLVLTANTRGQPRPVFSAGYHIGGFDGAAHDPRTGVRRPEDDRLVRRAEGGVATVGRPAGALVDGREAQVTVGRTAERLVLLQDRAGDDMRAGIGGEEDLARGKVLPETVTGRVDATVLGAQRTGLTAAGLPGRGDRRVGITFRRGDGRRRHQHRREQSGAHEPYRKPPGNPAKPGSLPGHRSSPKSCKTTRKYRVRQLCVSRPRSRGISPPARYACRTFTPPGRGR